MDALSGSAFVSQVDPRQYFREVGRYPTWRLCPSSHDHPEPIILPVVRALSAFYDAPPVNELAA